MVSLGILSAATPICCGLSVSALQTGRLGKLPSMSASHSTMFNTGQRASGAPRRVRVDAQACPITSYAGACSSFDLVQAMMLIVIFTFTFVSLLVDVAYAWRDPGGLGLIPPAKRLEESSVKMRTDRA